LFDWLRGGPPDESASAAPATGAVLPPAPTPADITAALDRMGQLTADASLSSAVVARVERVVNRLRETVPRMDHAGLASVDQYALIATATSYLPEALGNYLRLPRDWANTRPILGGKSALLILIDQLDLLGATADKMYDAVLQKDARALIEHGRFLEERFNPGRAAPPPVVPTPVSALDATANPLDLEAP
jgi:hypothetical protein